MRSAWRPTRQDLLLSFGATLFGTVEVVLNSALAPRGAALACDLVLALAVAFRTVRPLVVSVVVSVACLAEIAAGVPLDQPFLPLLVVVLMVYTLVSHVPPWQAVTGVGVIIVGMAAETVVAGKGPSNFLFGVVFFGLAGFLGWAVRRRTQDVLVAEQAVSDSVAETHKAVAAERARLARELHDVISHSVSAMVVQAGAAERMLVQAPDQAFAAVRAVGEIGRDALAELARLLGVLREFGEEVGLEPQPGLSDLDALFDRSRALGVPVDVVEDGTAVPLPTGVELTIFRIVQEALTNVRKHAPGVTSLVRLTFEPAGVVVEITNPAPERRSNGSAVPGAGHGLLGMRERVAVYGGTLQCGEQMSGGFSVLARIPFGPAR